MTSILDFSPCDMGAGTVGLFVVLSDRLITRYTVPPTGVWVRGCTGSPGGDRGQGGVSLSPWARETNTWPRRNQGAQPPGNGHHDGKYIVSSRYCVIMLLFLNKFYKRETWSGSQV